MSFEVPLTPASYTLSRATPPSKLDLPAVVPLDEPPMNGITIQPPTAVLQDTRPAPVDTTTNAWRSTLKGLPSAGSPSQVSPGGRSSRSGLGSASVSPSTRSRQHRALSPDLPTRDCLYLFSNFSSYMRSPNEGPQGISGNEDFKDTIRLLDFARTLVAQPHSNVHILHLKYRFQSPAETRQSTYASGDRRLPANWVDATGRLRNPVPQPFSVARDPVLKIDYQENGVFTPLPAQAIFNHISKACYPPPRLIVASFVNSMVTQNHISQLATWALTSSPPCYILSPLETRIRILHPIQYTLHHAIPMSMYAQPEPDPAASPTHISPTHSVGYGSIAKEDRNDANARRRYSDNSLPAFEAVKKSLGRRSLTRDPIASLTIVSSPVPFAPGAQGATPPQLPNTASSCGTNANRGYTQSDRIPLWALAPGMNVLQGSTSASIGIKLSDFSALNMVNQGDDAPRTISSDAAPKIGVVEMPDGGIGLAKTLRGHHSGAVWVDSSPIQAKHKILVPPVEPISRSSTPANIDNIGNNGDSGHPSVGHRQHLTPPEKFTPPDLFGAAPRSVAFPKLARIPHWRRGRKELAEDVLEELSKGLELDGVLEDMRALGLWELETDLHTDRMRRSSEEVDATLLQYLRTTTDGGTG